MKLKGLFVLLWLLSLAAPLEAAVTFVGKATYQTASSTETTSSVTSTLSAGSIQIGDILEFFVCADETIAVTVSQSFGATLLDSHDSATDDASYGCAFYAFYKIAVSADTSAGSFSFTNSTADDDTIILLDYRSTSAVDVHAIAGQYTSGETTSGNSPTATTTVANDLVTMCWGVSSPGQTIALNAGLTSRANVTTSSAPSYYVNAMACGDEAGPSSPGAVTALSSSWTNAANYTSELVAIEPSGGGGSGGVELIGSAEVF